jgi:Domain of unknown function (DUF1848)
VIVSASYRTDIPAFYAPWLLRRLAAGSCRVANPYGGGAYEVPLRPGEVDGFVLWTRNLRPLLPALDRVRQVAPFVVQFTLTAYPRALESSVIAAEEGVAQLREVRRRYGPRVAVWRYDPVVFADVPGGGLDLAAHRARFAALARALRGTVDEVVLSVVHPYRKTRRNLDRAALRHGFLWRDPPPEEKRALLAALALVAKEHAMAPSLCSQPELLAPGLGEASCIDAARLADVAQRPVAARQSGNRPGCRCALSRDIGAYDTCPHGCAYCYAVADRDRAVANFRRHDPAAPILRG